MSLRSDELDDLRARAGGGEEERLALAPLDVWRGLCGKAGDEDRVWL
jgi:hypothetical protein